MHFQDLYSSGRPTFSFEFFPPKSAAAADELVGTIRELQPLKPSFVSITYGAGGSTRQLTAEVVRRVRGEVGLEVVPHLTCIMHTEAEIYDTVEVYARENISNILALGGDPPADQPRYDRSRDAFRYAAQLVKFLADFNTREGGRSITDPRGFGIAVAGFPEGHPGTPNRLVEIEHLKAKVDAGASVIITQMFFDNRDFYDYRDRCRLAGIKVPIVAGIMPITSAPGMRRMAALAAGARFPAALQRSIGRALSAHAAADSPEARAAVRRIGVHWATEQCRDLLDHGVDGIHLYTLNHSTATREIYATLGVADSAALAAPHIRGV